MEMGNTARPLKYEHSSSWDSAGKSSQMLKFGTWEVAISATEASYRVPAIRHSRRISLFDSSLRICDLSCLGTS